jgi:hypothetical protein
VFGASLAWLEKASMNTVVAIRGDFDATFPDLKGLPHDADRVPGRDLANVVANCLRRGGLAIVGPEYEEPFFAVRCGSGREQIEVLCYIYEPKAGVWVVEAGWREGFLDRLRGRGKPQGLNTVLTSLHEGLLGEPRVREMRWFGRLPADPFGEVEFGLGPFSD